jgi:serine palmitoyltransferase
MSFHVKSIGFGHRFMKHSGKVLHLMLSPQEIDELCGEWEPEPLCPPIKEGARINAPTLERFV